ncbi:MAG: CPBP family intramembrane metalloprotease [Patescibacteria group bacterium]|nr:CPBP family intramembrane metalloprotease [Patescibacteria group bacterium]
MKHKSLIAYLVIITLLSAVFIVLMKLLGQKGNYLAAFYMLGPAIAAIITRLFFYDKKFKDANLRFGKVKNYFKFWAIALSITVLSLVIYTLLGSISWDFSGQVFLGQLAKQFALTGQNINNLPAGLTPQLMLIIYFIGGLTIFNILPGVITGFGEEFGWRGFMFPQMYKIKPWVAFIVGGLIWYAWHIPLVLVIAQTQTFTIAQTILNVAVLAIGSICTHTFLAYVYVKSKNVFVASVTHITLDNVARSFAYFIIIQNQITANIGLAITMLIVVAVLYFSKEWKVFENYFNKREIENYE